MQASFSRLGAQLALLAIGFAIASCGTDSDEPPSKVPDFGEDGGADGSTGADGAIADGGGDGPIVPEASQDSGDGGDVSWRYFDLFEDQEVVLPGNAEVGDTVGRVHLYPTVEVTSPAFSVVGNVPAFSLDSSGELSVLDATALSVGSVDFTVRVDAQGWRDEATIRVRILDPAKVEFIDPGNHGDPAKDGTRAHPWSSWGQVSWKEDTAYLQRRGTVAMETEQVAIGADGVLLGAWGAGALPILDSVATHGVSGWRKARLEVRDLEVRVDSSSTSSLNWSSPTDLVVVGCVLHGGVWGLRFTGDPAPVGVRVLWTEIFDTGDDGMFVQNVQDFEVGGVHVHHVNTNWKPPQTPETEAAGDAIQLHRVHGFRVHHSRLDRTSSGNKFCFIANECSQGVFEHNLVSGPMQTPVGGASIYIGGTPLTHSTIVRYNTFLGPTPTAIYSYAPDLQVVGNLFVGMPRALWTNNQVTVLHNVFSGVGEAITGGGDAVVRNNIFHLREPGDVAFGGMGELTQDHNLFSRDPGLPGVLVGDPRFVDADAMDFHLEADSPAIDQGMDVGVTQDREGTSIPQGAGPDMGAFERW